MFEHGGAVSLVMGIQDNARGRRPADKLCQDDFAPLDRQLAHIVTVQLEQIERAQYGVGMRRASAPDQVEDGEPVLIADDCLAIDKAGTCGQRLDRARYRRETLGEVVAFPSEKPHAGGIPPRYDAEAVMLDFVDPARARRWPPGQAGQARFNSAVRAAATQYHARKIGQIGKNPSSSALNWKAPRRHTRGPRNRRWGFGGLSSPVHAISIRSSAVWFLNASQG